MTSTKQINTLVFAVLLAGLIITALSWRYTLRVVEGNRKQDFELYTVQAEDVLKRRIQAMSEVLQGVQSAFYLQPRLSRSEFRRMVYRNGFIDRYPGIQVAGFIQVVTPAQKATYEESVRTDRSIDPTGYRQFSIRPPGDRSEYFPITYVAPMNGNEKAFGFDIGSEPVRRSAMEMARDSGQQAATGGITLVQEKETQTGFLLMAPLYSYGMPIQTVEQRRQAFQGLVFLGLRVGETVHKAFSGRFLDRMNLQIFGVPRPGEVVGKQVLFDSRQESRVQQADSRLNRESLLDVGGRQWRLVFSDQRSDFGTEQALPWLVMFSGTAISLLLAWLVLTMANSQRRSVALAEQMTRQLRDSELRSRAVLDNVLDGIITINERGVVESFNKAAERIFGYAAAEVIGNNVKMLMPEPYHGQHDGYLFNYVSTGKKRIIGIGREVIGLRKEGSAFPMDLSISEMQVDGQRIFTGVVRDISQRRAAAEAMARVSGINQAILDNADHSIIATDTEGKILIFNHAAERMLGYRAEEMVGKLTPAVIHDPDEVRQRAEALVASGVSVEPGFEVFVVLSRQGLADTNEWSYIRKDGTRFPVSLTVTALHDAQGEITGYLGVATDITERKLAEKELHKLFRAIEQSPVSVVITDASGDIEYINAKFSEVTGYRLDEVIGKNPRILQSGLTPAEVYRDMWNTLLEGNEWRGRLHNRKKNGELYWEYAYISSIHDGKGAITHFVAVKEDITERMRIEEELAAASRRNELILNTVDEGIYGVDLEGKTTFINPAGLRMLGFSVEELLGRVQHPLTHHTHSDGTPYPANECHIYASYLYGKTYHVSDEVFWRKDGSSFPVEYVSTPIVEGGNIVGAVVSFRDITERQKIELMKNEFISTVSHELRTPLTSIRGSLGLIAGGVAGALSPQLKVLVDIANKNSERLILLVNDILDIEKIESGKMQFDMKPLELVPLIEQALVVNRAYGDQFNVGFTLERPARAVMVNVDEGRLMQVMANLLSNAAKFSPVGGTVNISVRCTEKGVRISVADHGQGIPEEFRNKIFQKFSQADSSDTRKKGGSGLGLSITKAIVEQMGGSIRFDSEVAVGTTFFIDFPEWLEQSGPGSQADVNNLNRILICEENRDTARLLQMMLKQGGFDSDIAHSSTEAQELLRHTQYRAITLDIMLPGQDGVSLLHDLHANKASSDIPIIVVSAQTGQHGNDLESGSVVLDWLDKPIDEVRLMSALRRVTRQGGNKPVILHVEDDADIRQVLAGLVGNEVELVAAATLADAKEKLETGRFDLIILDIGLPDGSGLDLLPLLNERRLSTPVMIFSAGDSSSEISRQVAAALVKARTSNEVLLATIKQLIGRA